MKIEHLMAAIKATGADLCGAGASKEERAVGQALRSIISRAERNEASDTQPKKFIYFVSYLVQPHGSVGVCYGNLEYQGDRQIGSIADIRTVEKYMAKTLQQPDRDITILNYRLIATA